MNSTTFGDYVENTSDTLDLDSMRGTVPSKRGNASVQGYLTMRYG